MPARRPRDPLQKFAQQSTLPPAVLLDWMIGGGLIACLGVAGWMLGSFIHSGWGMLHVTWLMGLLLVLHGVWWAINRDRPAIHWHGLWPLPLLLLGAWSIWGGHSSAPWLGRQQWVALGCGAAAYWLVLHHVRGRLQWVMLWAGVALVLVAVGIALAQLWFFPEWLPLDRLKEEKHLPRASGIFAVPNHFAGLLLLVWPGLVLLAAAPGWPRWLRWGAGLAAGWVLLGLLLSVSRGGWLAAGLALALLPIFLFRPWWQRLAGVTAVVVLAVGGAWLAYQSLPIVRERVDRALEDGGEWSRPIMWQVAWDLYAERPALGWGLGTYEVLFDRHSPEHFVMRPEYAHNEYAQLASELGWVGLALFVGPALALGGLLFWRWAKLPWRTSANPTAEAEAALPTSRPRPPAIERVPPEKILLGGAWLGLLAFAAHLFVDFHLKYGALVLAAALTLGLAVRAAERRHSPIPTRWPAQVLGLVLSLGAAAGLVGVGLPTYTAAAETFIGDELFQTYQSARAEAATEPERAAGYDEQFLARRVQAAFERALAAEPDNGQALVGLAKTLIQRQQDYHLRSADRSFAQRALSVAGTAAAQTPHWWRPWTLQAVAGGLARHPFAELRSWHERALAEAPNTAPVWYAYALLLTQAALVSEDPTLKTLANDATARVLVLDPLHRGGLSLRRRLENLHP